MKLTYRDSRTRWCRLKQEFTFYLSHSEVVRQVVWCSHFTTVMSRLFPSLSPYSIYWGAQLADCTFIGVDGLIVLAGTTFTEWYEARFAQGFHVLKNDPIYSIPAIVMRRPRSPSSLLCWGGPCSITRRHVGIHLLKNATSTVWNQKWTQCHVPSEMSTLTAHYSFRLNDTC